MHPASASTPTTSSPVTPPGVSTLPSALPPSASEPKGRIVSPSLDSIRSVNSSRPSACPVYQNQASLVSVTSGLSHSGPKSLDTDVTHKADSDFLSIADSANSLALLDQSRTGKEIFTACKVGDLGRLKKHINSWNVNIRDTSGGRSTVSEVPSPPLSPSPQPLHFAAGFGRQDVVEFLIQSGANIHAKDDGGLG